MVLFDLSLKQSSNTAYPRVNLRRYCSGMWGIFYYREISNPRAIRNWFLSASLSVSGIIWLSRERIMATRGSA
jgi:hypothetical protein